MHFSALAVAVFTTLCAFAAANEGFGAVQDADLLARRDSLQGIQERAADGDGLDEGYNLNSDAFGQPKVLQNNKPIKNSNKLRKREDGLDEGYNDNSDSFNAAPVLANSVQDS